MERLVIINAENRVLKAKMEDFKKLPKDLQKIMFKDISYRKYTMSEKNDKVYAVLDQIELRMGPNGAYLKRKAISGITYHKEGRGKVTNWHKEPINRVDTTLLAFLFGYMDIKTNSKVLSVCIKDEYISPGLLKKVLQGKITTYSDVVKHLITYKLKVKGVTQKHYKEVLTFAMDCSSLYNTCMLLRSAEDPVRFLEAYKEADLQEKQDIMAGTSITLAEKAIKLGRKIDWIKGKNISLLNEIEKEVDFVHDVTHFWTSNNKKEFKRPKMFAFLDDDDMPF